MAKLAAQGWDSSRQDCRWPAWPLGTTVAPAAYDPPPPTVPDPVPAFGNRQSVGARRCQVEGGGAGKRLLAGMAKLAAQGWDSSRQRRCRWPAGR